jgi:chromosome segregation ATPase
VRRAALALLREHHVGAAPSTQAFRRAVSIRKDRERLGGGNPATIGRVLNALEAELAQDSADEPAIPGLPAEVAQLMEQLWQLAVGVQLDDLARLRTESQAIASGARAELAEAELRAEVLMQELAEHRAHLADRDARLAQATTELAAQRERAGVLQAEVERERDARLGLATELEAGRAAQAAAVAAAQERYEGLGRRLLDETAQQRQAAKDEMARQASQLKFAEKRQAALEGRLQQLEEDLVASRAAHQQASGEVAALRYVNTAQRDQLDGLVRRLQAPPPAPAASGRKRRTPPGKPAA